MLLSQMNSRWISDRPIWPSMWRIVGILLLIGVPIATVVYAIVSIADAINPQAKASAAWAAAAQAQANAVATQAMSEAFGMSIIALAGLGIVAAGAFGLVTVAGLLLTAWQRHDDARREHELLILKLQQPALPEPQRREIIIVDAQGEKRDYSDYT